MISPTSAAATSGIGWSNGMASQVSLPSMLVLRPLRGTGPRRHDLQQDALEEVGIDVAIGERGHRDALLGQLGIALPVQDGTALAGLLDPGGEAVRRDHIDGEMHVGEAGAAIVARQPAIGALMVGAEMEPR